MKDDDQLAALRKARNEAFASFRKNPSEGAKADYQAAQSAYGAARKKAEVEDDRSWSSPLSGLPKEVDDARLAANAARRAVYANPSPEAKLALNAAQNEYQRIRLKLDPEFKAKVAAANARKHELAKLDTAKMEKRREAIRKWKAKQKAKKAEVKG